MSTPGPTNRYATTSAAHDLPVTLVGNGGGYAYGVNGETHHALGDYGALLCLRNMHVFVPAFAADVPVMVERLSRFTHPAYLRLGRCELPPDAVLPPYSPWRRLTDGRGPTLLVVGPLVGGIWAAVRNLPANRRPTLWVVAELPISEETIPAEFLDDLDRARHLMVVEEHVAHGSAGQALSYLLAKMGRPPQQFTHRVAEGYPTGYFGSQMFHRKECGLDPESIVAAIANS